MEERTDSGFMMIDISHLKETRGRPVPPPYGPVIIDDSEVFTFALDFIVFLRVFQRLPDRLNWSFNMLDLLQDFH